MGLKIDFKDIDTDKYSFKINKTLANKIKKLSSKIAKEQFKGVKKIKPNGGKAYVIIPEIKGDKVVFTTMSFIEVQTKK